MTDAQLDFDDPRWDDEQTALDDHADDPETETYDHPAPHPEGCDCSWCEDPQGQTRT